MDRPTLEPQFNPYTDEVEVNPDPTKPPIDDDPDILDASHNDEFEDLEFTLSEHEYKQNDAPSAAYAEPFKDEKSNSRDSYGDDKAGYVSYDQRKKKARRKAVLMGSAVVLLIVIIAISVASALSSKNQNKSETSVTAPVWAPAAPAAPFAAPAAPAAPTAGAAPIYLEPISDCPLKEVYVDKECYTPGDLIRVTFENCNQGQFDWVGMYDENADGTEFSLYENLQWWTFTCGSNEEGGGCGDEAPAAGTMFVNALEQEGSFRMHLVGGVNPYEGMARSQLFVIANQCFDMDGDEEFDEEDGIEFNGAETEEPSNWNTATDVPTEDEDEEEEDRDDAAWWMDRDGK
ncbi:MAG: hypothetical protein SGILL_005687 [Bacillariaceae sp.]